MYFTIVKFVLEKLDKNLGFADPHPPQLGRIPKLFQKLDLKASLRGGIKKCFFFTFSQKIETPPPPPPFLTTSVFSDKDFFDLAQTPPFRREC